MEVLSKVHLKQSWFDTPLGSMLAIADERQLYFLEFEEQRHLPRQIERIQMNCDAEISTGLSAPIQSIQTEMQAYFAGTLKTFKTPLRIFGSPFQKRVWEALLRIPYGQTKSYSQQAMAIGQANACRAVANANGANQLAIVIPCHRIIQHNGTLGGYGGGLHRKQWLLDHEKQFM